MVLRNWPSWLKGGIIISIIITLTGFLLTYMNPEICSIQVGDSKFSGSSELSFRPLCNIFFPISIFINDIYENSSITLLTSLIFYFIIGSIIGAIYGKKSKNN